MPVEYHAKFKKFEAAVLKHQQRYQQKEEQLRFVLEGSELGFWDWDIVNNTVERNERWAIMLGYTYEELKNTTKQWADFIHPEDRKRAWQSIREVLEGRSLIHRSEYRMIHKDGSIRWIRDQAKVVQRDAEGKPTRMCGTHSDITHRILIEQQVQASEERLRLFIDHAPAALAMLDRKMHYLAVSQRWLEDYQLGVRDILGRSHYELFPDLPETWKQVHLRGLSGEVVKNDNDAFIREDGTVQWLKWEVRPWYINPETVGGIIIFTEDITKRKQNEETLKLAALVYQNSNEAMIITDANNRIIDINPAFTKLTGYRKDEILGKTPKVLDSGHHDAEFFEALWTELNKTGHWRGEIWNQNKQGQRYAVLLSINTIYNQEGSVNKRVALYSDITDKQNADEKIWHQANYDPLTQLPNRSLFFDRLNLEIKKAERDRSMAALLFIDLDRFKEVNDSLGHAVGDLLLIEAANRIERCVRDCDTVARLGGDEFVIILTELHDTMVPSRIAQNVIHQLSQAFLLNDQPFYISGSIGITIYPDDGQTSEDLLKKADQAMYAAKKAGRNGFRFFTHAMQESVILRSTLANDLRQALANGQMKVFYQPIIELSSGHIHKAEALIRWEHPELGFISPGVFIPIAEDTGMIHEIGDWVFSQAAQQIKQWQQTLGEQFQISVNKSPLQFRKQIKGQVPWVKQLKEWEISCHSIVIEITEGILMRSEESVQNILLAYRDAGIQVAIDDFGTGYSALSYLKKFDIDYLKIDRLFIQNLASGETDFALCEAMVVMAKKLGIRVIAEGVETEQQRDLLTQIGCHYGQGYLFSKPLPADMFENILHTEYHCH